MRALTGRFGPNFGHHPLGLRANRTCPSLAPQMLENGLSSLSFPTPVYPLQLARTVQQSAGPMLWSEPRHMCGPRSSALRDRAIPRIRVGGKSAGGKRIWWPSSPKMATDPRNLSPPPLRTLTLPLHTHAVQRQTTYGRFSAESC